MNQVTPSRTNGRSAAPGKPVARLSEPQRSLIVSLKGGASLLHHEAQTTGLFRLTEAGRSRTVHPATVESLIAGGFLTKDLFGRLWLAETHDKV